jgi:hypothetical protein
MYFCATLRSLLWAAPLDLLHLHAHGPQLVAWIGSCHLSPSISLQLTNFQIISAQDQEQWEAERASLISKNMEAISKAHALRENFLNLKLELSSLKDSLQPIADQVNNEKESFISTLRILQNSIQKEAIRHQDEIEELTSSYRKELSERRKYFNMVQDLKGNLWCNKVCIFIQQ